MATLRNPTYEKVQTDSIFPFIIYKCAHIGDIGRGNTIMIMIKYALIIIYPIQTISMKNTEAESRKGRVTHLDDECSVRQYCTSRRPGGECRQDLYGYSIDSLN